MMASEFHRCIMYIVVLNVGAISEVALHEELHASFHSSPIKTEFLLPSPPHDEKIISPKETTGDAVITEKEVVVKEEEQKEQSSNQFPPSDVSYDELIKRLVKDIYSDKAVPFTPLVSSSEIPSWICVPSFSQKGIWVACYFHA